MPAEARHDRAGIDESAELLQLEQEVEVEGQPIAVVDATDALPGIGAHEHPRLRDEVRPPGQDPWGESAGATDPQFALVTIDIPARAESDDSIRMRVQRTCRRTQRTRLQLIVIIEPVHISVPMPAQPMGDADVDRPRQAPRVGDELGVELGSEFSDARCVEGHDDDDIGRDVLTTNRAEGLAQVLRATPERRDNEEHFGTLRVLPHDGYRRAVTAAQPPAEGAYLHQLAAQLFPLDRSITGNGVRQSLAIIGKHVDGLQVHEVPSGTAVLDWTVPDEWNVRSAYVEDPSGQRIIDFAECNVHLVSYSEPVDVHLPLADLQEHLHSDAELPDAIPYVTSYYHRTWGFCLTQEQRDALVDGEYHAVIDATLEPGSLTYADVVIPGELDAEILLTTYICHPSMANNELSGPMVAVGLIRWLQSMPTRRYTYRFVFEPETIGAITYIAKHLDVLRTNVVAAINLTCIGDDGDYSYLASRLGNAAIDRIARRVVRTRERAVEYSYLDRGSDERHYGMPGVDVPMISLMRTKYGAFREYHTHLDDLTVVTPTGLQGGLDLVRDCLHELETTDYYRATVLGEPQLGRRGLYHRIHARTVADEILLRTHVLAYADGQHSVADMAELFGVTPADVQVIVDELVEHDLLVATPLRKASV